MPQDTMQRSSPATGMWMPLPTEGDEAASLLSDVGWWLTGGASLLLWTGVALLLTSA
jgi:hypothetical protein